VRVARAVNHPCAPEVRREGVGRSVVAVGRAVELFVAGQVARLLRRLDADDAPLMPRVPAQELLAVTAAVLARPRKVARRVRVEPRRVGVVERQCVGRGDDVPLYLEAAQAPRGLRRQLKLTPLRRQQLRVRGQPEELPQPRRLLHIPVGHHIPPFSVTPPTL
jgi:hypothetical protein